MLLIFGQRLIDYDGDVRGNWNVSSEEGIEAKRVEILEATRPADGDPPCSSYWAHDNYTDILY